MNRKELISEIDIQISEFKNILKSEENHDILEEKVLNLLCEIDGKISEIVGNKDSIQKEIIFHRFIAMHLIDTQFTSIDDFLDDYLAIAYKEIENRTTLLSHDLFIPGTSNIEKSDTEKKNKKNKLLKAYKNKILKRVLNNLGYKPSDIQKVFLESLNAHRMRNIPYNIYHLDKFGKQKTILICDEIGQATFVYDGIIDTDIFQDIEKGETIGNSQALKIIYSQTTFETNLEIALSDQFTFEEKEEKIVNEDEEKSDVEKKEKITKEELFDIMFNFQDRTVQESYDYFMSLTTGNSKNPDSIQGLNIKGNSVTALKNISGINIEGNIQDPSEFREWIQEVFKGQKVKIQELEKKEKITKEELFDIMFNFQDRTVQESYDYFMSLTTGNSKNPDSIKGLNIKGNKVGGLKTISGIIIEGNIYSLLVFREWIQEIFKGQKIIFQELEEKEEKEEKEELTKKELFAIMHNYQDRTVQESYDYFMSLVRGYSNDKNSIRSLKIKGYSVTALKTISGINTEGNIETLLVFREWIQEIFKGQKITFQELEKKEKKEELTKEELFATMYNYQDRTVQESYDYFMSLSQGKADNPDSIAGLKIKGNSIRSLKTISGIDIEGNIGNSSVFREWIQEVFDGQDIIFQEF